MRLKNDDSLRAVNAVFLGPRGQTLPWAARYVCYAVGVPVFLLVVFVERRAGVAMSIQSLLAGIGLTVLITTLIGQWVDYERPVRTLLVTFAHELSARRPARAVSHSYAARRYR